jgi:hypothetical protein
VRAIPGVAERISNNVTATSTHHLKERQVSLHAIVQGTFAGRRRPRRDIAARATAGAAAVPLRISISSMRILETSLALSAIATALLIGSGR